MSKKRKTGERIYMKVWMDLKHYRTPTVVDEYYLDLANDIKKSFVDGGCMEVLRMCHLQASEVDKLACLFAAHLEDVVSGTRIWDTFLKLHRRMYGKWLPFYETETDRKGGEMEYSDICFLSWYFLNTLQHNEYLMPYDERLFAVARMAWQVLDAAWEYAPENGLTKAYFKFTSTGENFYDIRDFLNKFLMESYLFREDIWPKTEKKLNNYIEILREEGGEPELIAKLLHDTHVGILHTARTSLLSLRGRDWLLAYIGEDHPLYRDIEEMSPRILGAFLFKGRDERHIHVEHIATGKKFAIVENSIKDMESSPVVVDDILRGTFVRWRGEWWQSGFSAEYPHNPKAIEEERNSARAKRELDVLERDEALVLKLMKEFYNAFVAFNGGSPIAFLSPEEVDAFIQRFFDFLRDSGDFSPEELKQFKEHKEHFEKTELELLFILSDDDEPCVLFFNPRRGFETWLGDPSVIPIPENPFFDPENFDELEVSEDLFAMFVDVKPSPEMVKYYVEQAKKFPFFEKLFPDLPFEDFDFLLRFWKKETYHGEPQLFFE